MRMNLIRATVLAITLGCIASVPAETPDLVHQPYLLDTGLTSRSISFENPTGEPGKGGTAAHERLGPGRKGAPAKTLQPGESVQLCDISASGTIRHIWITTAREPEVQRAGVIRAYWDGQEHPSIECPLGDLFGYAHGKIMPYMSAAHSVGSTGGLNIWLPMPFTKRARLTFTNESSKAVPFFYQIDYTIGDKHPADVGRLHVLFRRENPTTLKQDFELLPKRTQKGRFMGAVIGVRNLTPGQWWGEGEIKIYMDGDTDLPTIVGTGSEDYVGLAWGLQQHPFLYNGASLVKDEFISMYRWHLPDPVAWRKEARITMQQIAWASGQGLAETQDDWSTATFWYEPVPSAALPPLPNKEARTADIWADKPADKPE